MTRLFQINGTNLMPAKRKPLDLETKIEAWVANDLTLIGVDGFVIGRQIATDHGKFIDILAMDEDGNLVIIELKRDRSPRDIVAQVLDYASWVRRLSTGDVHALAMSLDVPLAKAYRDQFGTSLPQTLNASHQMVVVASEVDEGTKRIIEYLSEEHDVGINAAFFNVFEAGGQEWLTTDALLDQEEVKDRAVKKVQAPWSGYYYVTGGSEEDRPWADLREYGFFTVSGKQFFTKRLDQLSVGDKVFYYQKKNGYLGYGLITAEKVAATDYVLPDGQPLIDALPRDYLTENAGDPDNCAYVVGVDWQKTVSVNDARTFSGIFSNQNVVCKIRHQETADFLKEQFGVREDHQ
ncbi:endonuclease NucS domain-containing protein [Ruegeria lacuscaerulensis]|uniref:endonuclease NucS domain-containing protein n=1 Tax=Ruegeria lacuscaerulensis TaxID=55218 RepID=UPI00147D9A0A|nr:endonuclease NucS domain-containing protein [Ruegeria lacuscaerulensis]